MENYKRYDVLITGGGMAGLTVALQLKQTKPDISILVLEKRKDEAPIATHKVGESLSEMASFYLREVLNLKDYLINHQLRKFGFRFFFTPEYSEDIVRRVEVGSKIFNPFPSHQVDRGLLENELVQRLEDRAIDIVMGAKVTDIALSKKGHKITYVKENLEYDTEVKWIVDSSGRSGLLKRKLGLQKEIYHDINASWFRLDALIDIDDWSDNLAWRNFVAPGLRYLATNHLMGEGYWVWIIPLVCGKTSIGIVADPRYHPFDGFNTFEKAMQWLEKCEPHAARMLEIHKEKLMDFKVMKHFAYDSKQFYSSDRWAVTGEAGAFMDPFYSPGSDMIALSNSWITDLIVRDLNGEDTALRTLIYDFAHKELLNGWITVYKDMYGIFGKTQIMLMKIIWDWASYWAIPNVLFANKGYTDITILRQYSASESSIGRRFAKLNYRMQALFRTWGQYDIEPCSDQQLNVFDLSCLRQFQSEIGKQYEPGELMPKIQSNLIILEQISAEIFRLASAQVNDTAIDMKVDPYTMMIEDGKAELLKKSKSQNSLSVVEPIRADIAKMWFSIIKNTQK
ncbi:MAG TPA: tryptophan 7-halogenase [Chitinophagaceae bacterium]|nr:tryptophan 7-halogenase [Chitinophagaceae bacterium]